MRAAGASAVLLAMVLASASSARGADAAADLRAFIDRVWAFRLQEDPLLATSVGEHRYNDRLPSVTPADDARREAFWREAERQLAAIDRTALGGEDRVSYAMLKAEIADTLAEFRFRPDRIPITADSGFHIGFARLAKNVPLNTVKDYESYIARLRAWPAYVDQHIALMREGLQTGFTMPRIVLEGFEGTISAHVVDDPTRSVFDEPFKTFPTGVPASEHEHLRAAGRMAIAEAIVPGYRKFLDFMVGEYIPKARATTGAADLPEGKEFYAWRVRHFTTLDITPQEVHELGLSEVARIRKDMDDVIRQVKFEGDFAAFLKFLRTDPRFYAKTPEELLKEASRMAKRMDARLPSLFGRLPRQPYGVEPVPAELAPKYTGGRYVGAPLHSTRAGTYWVNTYALESRPLYVLEALTLHEAVPGHHLQVALSQELTDLPAFRRHAYVNAFGEGWGLYSERLGLEAGFYTDPYSNFGRLTYEMWRACRLVVDTGLHALRWSREKALDFMGSNTALSLHEVRTEIDRYIAWPGQALAYKTGELKIRALRKEAEDALGTRFDVRAFHDVVLASGSVPLPVLEEKVRGWIRERMSAS